MATTATNRLGGGKNVGTQRGDPARPAVAGGELPAQEKLGGVAWWLVLGFLALIDLGSMLVSLLFQGLGIAVTATGFGAPVGIPIAVLGWICGAFLMMNALIITIGYLLLNHVPLLGARKLAIWGLNVIIEAVPIMSAFPTATLVFLIITITENMKRGSGVLARVAQKAMAKAGPVGAIAGKVLAK